MPIFLSKALCHTNLPTRQWILDINLPVSVKDVHRRQKLRTEFFQTLWVYYFGCEYLNFEKKKYAYRGFQGVIF